jgi:hypothetical protein
LRRTRRDPPMSVKVRVVVARAFSEMQDPAAWSGDLCEEPVTFRGGDAGVSCYGISSPPVARGGHQGPLRYCRLGSCPSTPLAERPRPSHRRWRARNCFGLHASRQVEDVSRSCPACRLRAPRTLSKRYVIDARLATRRRHLRARRRGWIFLEKQNAAALTSLAECPVSSFGRREFFPSATG